MKQQIGQKSLIPIKKLQLWDENARFPDKYFNQSESELVNYFLGKKHFKLRDFAKEIVKDFDLMQAEDLIVYIDNGSYIVVEGNRRLAIYKLLVNPELAHSQEDKKHFKHLCHQLVIDGNHGIHCIIADDRATVDRYLERKHLKKNNEIGWGDNEKSHYKARRGKANYKDLLKKELSKTIATLPGLPESLKEDILGPGYITTFTRLLCGTPAKNHFGFELDANDNLKVSNKETFIEELTIIIYDILTKKIDSRKKLDNNENQNSYLKSIDIKNYQAVLDEISNSKSQDLLGNETVFTPTLSSPIIRKISKPKSTSRTTLIPRTCILSINNSKINNIYRELREDLLLNESKQSVPNAVAVLFRVFLELSLDYFITKYKNEFKLKGDAKLKSKITCICDFLEQQEIATTKQLKNIRKVPCDTNNPLAIENFHGYVHDYDVIPSPIDLKSKWDKLQEFFELLWGAINKKKGR